MTTSDPRFITVKKSLEAKGVDLIEAKGNTAIFRATSVEVLDAIILALGKCNIDYDLIDPVTFKITA